MSATRHPPWYAAQLITMPRFVSPAAGSGGGCVANSYISLMLTPRQSWGACLGLRDCSRHGDVLPAKRVRPDAPAKRYRARTDGGKLAQPREQLQCPLWVKSRHWGRRDRCPLYPQKQTLELSRVMSALCQKRTLRTAAKISLCGFRFCMSFIGA